MQTLAEASRHLEDIIGKRNVNEKESLILVINDIEKTCQQLLKRIMILEDQNVNLHKRINNLEAIKQ